MCISSLVYVWLTEQDRLRALISDPKNDANMIEGTLALKRFADTAVQYLCDNDQDRLASDRLPPDDITHEERMEDGLARTVLSLHFSKRQVELQDIVRVGCKAGMGSRQNAPAEWIGTLQPQFRSRVFQVRFEGIRS